MWPFLSVIFWCHIFYLLFPCHAIFRLVSILLLPLPVSREKSVFHDGHSSCMLPRLPPPYPSRPPLLCPRIGHYRHASGPATPPPLRPVTRPLARGGHHLHAPAPATSAAATFVPATTTWSITRPPPPHLGPCRPASALARDSPSCTGRTPPPRLGPRSPIHHRGTATPPVRSCCVCGLSPCFRHGTFLDLRYIVSARSPFH